MYDIPASCYSRHLSPQRHYEYTFEGRMAVRVAPVRATRGGSIDVVVRVPFCVEIESGYAIDVNDHDGITREIHDELEEAVREVLPTRCMDDVREVEYTLIQERW